MTNEDFKIDPNIYSGVKQLEKIKLFTMHRDAAVDRMKEVLAATNDERTSDFMNSMIRQLMTRSKPGTRFSKPHLSEKQLSALERVENRLGVQVPPEQADLPTREEVGEASDYYHNVIQHQRNAEMLAKRDNKEIDEIVEEEIDLYLEKKKKTNFSKEKKSGLHGWFSRAGGKGKSKGWVDCNTCRKGKGGRKTCKSCGRGSGENRAKYPHCRPTPSDCGTSKKSGKKSKAGKKG